MSSSDRASFCMRRRAPLLASFGRARFATARRRHSTTSMTRISTISTIRRIPMLHDPLGRRRLLQGLPLGLAALVPGSCGAKAAVNADAARQMIQEVGVQVLAVLRDRALDNLASRLHVYDGQDFEIVGAQAVNERDAVVATRVTGGGRPPLKVDWRVRELDGGDLVAIDVIVEGISLIVTQRSEFSSVIERRGMDGLLAELRQRV